MFELDRIHFQPWLRKHGVAVTAALALTAAGDAGLSELHSTSYNNVVYAQELDNQDSVDLSQTVKLSWLGTGNNFSHMHYTDLTRMIAQQTSFGFVRVAVEEGGELPKQVQNVISEARFYGLRLLLVYNPKQLISENETYDKLRPALNLVKGYEQFVFVEILNEPDHEKDSESTLPGLGSGKFFKNRDLFQAAQAVVRTNTVLSKYAPTIQPIIGALVKPGENAKLWYGFIRSLDPSLTKIAVAIHMHGDEKDLRAFFQFTRQAAGMQTPVYLTELGNYQFSVLGRTLREAIALGIPLVSLHTFDPYSPSSLTRLSKDSRVEMQPAVKELLSNQIKELYLLRE